MNILTVWGIGVIVLLLITLVNLVVLGLNLKIYTEFFKERVKKG